MSAPAWFARVTDGRNAATEVAQLRRLLRIVEDRERTATARLAAEQLKNADLVEQRRKLEAHRDRLMQERDEWRSLYRRDHMAWVAAAPESERTIPTPQEAENR